MSPGVDSATVTMTAAFLIGFASSGIMSQIHASQKLASAYNNNEVTNDAMS